MNQRQSIKPITTPPTDHGKKQVPAEVCSGKVYGGCRKGYETETPSSPGKKRPKGAGSANPAAKTRKGNHVDDSWLTQLAEPPIIDWDASFRQKIPSDLRYRAMFPGDPARIATMKDLDAEREAPNRERPCCKDHVARSCNGKCQGRFLLQSAQGRL